MRVRAWYEDRAYGPEHRRLRAILLPRAVGQMCPKCGQLMYAWQPLDLGHSTRARKRAGLPGDQIEHRRCNRSEGESWPGDDGDPEPPPIPPPSRRWV